MSEWYEADKKARLMCEKSFWIRSMHRNFLERIWDREIRIMTSFWQGRMKKVKKMKVLFEKIQCVTQEHRRIFLSEYYFACKLRFKLNMDIEAFFKTGVYDEQL